MESESQRFPQFRSKDGELISPLPLAEKAPPELFIVSYKADVRLDSKFRYAKGMDLNPRPILVACCRQTKAMHQQGRDRITGLET